MIFDVVSVSRGDIHLDDGCRRLRVLGEGLLKTKPDDQAFVVYLNSIVGFEPPNDGEHIDDDTRAKIIDAIKRHFERHGSMVDFE